MHFCQAAHKEQGTKTLRFKAISTTAAISCFDLTLKRNRLARLRRLQRRYFIFNATIVNLAVKTIVGN